MEKIENNQIQEGKKTATIGPKELVNMPAKQALDVITESLTPAYLVQSLAEEDFYLLIHEIGEEEALPVLARASNDQWQFMLDVALWEKDRMREGALNFWLDLLRRADPERLATWAMTENEELLSYYLYGNIEVRIKEQDESPSEFGEGFFSFDGVFYLKINPAAPSKTIKDLLRRMAALDPTLFHQFLINLAGAIPSFVEENLFRMRNVRLAEKGFLPFDEAMAIYQPLVPEKLLGEKEPPPKRKKLGEIKEKKIVPVSKSLLLKDGGPFQLALSRISDWDTLERLQREFAGMCNQLMSADNHIARSKEELAEVVRKACGYLNIGLERLGAKTPDDMATLVDTHPLSDIFRTGYGGPMEVKWRAERWLKNSWFHNQDLDFEFWGETKGGLLEGLLFKRPLFYVGISPEGESFRHFKQGEEIDTCEHALDEIMILDRWFAALFAHGLPFLPEDTYQIVHYKNLLLTAWSREQLQEKTKGFPVSQAYLKSFFSTLWAGNSKNRHVTETAKQSFLSWISNTTGRPNNDVSLLERDMIAALLEEIEKEYGAVALKDIDPRYIRHFLVAVT